MDILGLGWLAPYSSQLLAGLWLTSILSVASCAAGTFIGICCGWIQGQNNRIGRLLATSYMEIFRNTPLLAQVFFCYFGLAGLGLRMSPISAAMLALVLNCGAYCSEIFRAGFASIKVTQHEAAECLALSKLQTFIHVILPQVMRIVWVSLSGQFVLMILATSIVSQISVDELTSAASQVQSMTFRSFELYVILAVGYFAIAMFVKLILHWIGVYYFGEPRKKPVTTTLGVATEVQK